MKGNIIQEAKSFIGDLRSACNFGDDLFVVTVGVSRDGSAGNISVGMYDMKTGVLKREEQKNLYEKADRFAKFASSRYKGIKSIAILLTDEFEVSVFRTKGVLRICNLDA